MWHENRLENVSPKDIILGKVVLLSVRADEECRVRVPWQPRVEAKTMNHSVSSSRPIKDLCCGSFPLFPVISLRSAVS